MTEQPGGARSGGEEPDEQEPEGGRDAGEGELRRGAEPVEDETSQFGGPEGGQPTGS
jgi:hypothetical protein